MMQDSKEVMQSKISEFNKRNPVGAIVSVIKDFGEVIQTKVRCPASIIGEHTAVAWLKGISGGYRLDRVIGGNITDNKEN